MDASNIVESWTLFMQDVHDLSKSITFDVRDEDSPTIVGMDVKIYTVTENLTTPPVINMKRPTDND